MSDRYLMSYTVTAGRLVVPVSIGEKADGGTGPIRYHGTEYPTRAALLDLARNRASDSFDERDICQLLGLVRQN